MRKIFIYLTIVFLMSCKKGIHHKKADIENRIIDFYTKADAKNYQPIYFGDFDTLENVKGINGESIRITGVIKHGFTASSKLNGIRDYTEEFKVILFKDDIIILPKSYE